MTVALLLVVLLGAVTGLSLLAKRINVPYPVAFVIGGVALAFIPGLPAMALDPQYVFLLVLPPLLFSAGWHTDWIEFKRNRRPIALLAIGLVVFTTVVVAVVAHALMPALSWPLAFVLGAVVAPPDAIAAQSVLERLAVPRRTAAILSGESLVNDASALVFYRFAIAAVLSGAFSLTNAALAFVLVSIGGIAVGIVVALAFEFFQRFLTRMQLSDATLVTVLMLIAPYAAYLPAEVVHVSGVLAAVTAGIYLGRRSAKIYDSETRLIGGAFWSVFTFLLNGFVFIAIGLQLPQIVTGLSAPWHAALDAAVVSVSVIVVRVAWVFPGTYLPRVLSKRVRDRDPAPTWRTVALVSWAGMRGIVSLAAALAIPFVDNRNMPILARNEIVFIAFGVIFATLVVQGCTLGPLIAWLGISETSGRERQETKVRIRALEAGLERLHGLESSFTSTAQWEVAGRLIAEYERRIEHLTGHLRADAENQTPQNAIDHELQGAALQAERERITSLRGAGEIPDDVYRNIEYDLDLAQIRLS
ncbi:MAG TPA: Na+/H+ antiporter [Verrucomicrobiae bacterium]|jgi:CPA1 family monovalent cation:H+ antiporter|nr:Na+/H+ antiporter [Verrucomicrobiae bacterium]